MPSNVLSQQIVRAKLTGPGVDTLTGVVEFQFNPGKVKLAKTVKTDTTGKVKHSKLENAIVSSGSLVVTLDEIRFFGPATQQNVDSLLTWTEPTAETASDRTVVDRAAGATWGITKTGLPVLNLIWGSSMNYFVTLTQVTVNYQRFLPTGLPVRADCTLSLQEYPLSVTGTNPSSGGIPGRRQHVVVAEDSVVLIAHKTYGSSRTWRAVAEANKLDDPLRLRVGHRLFLPGPDELNEGVR